MLSYRRLRPTDRAAFERHMTALDDADRRRRFQASVSDDSVARHCRELDWLQTVIIGCFIDGDLRAAVEVHFDRVLFPHSAELAISVEAGWQHRGIGLELATRGMTAARNRGASSAILHFLPENMRMRRIVRRLGGSVGVEYGTIEALLALVPATPLSVWIETMEESGGALMGWADRIAA